MRNVKKVKSFLDDPRLDLQALGFDYRTRTDEGGEVFEYWDLDITEDMTLSVASTTIGGDRYETTTEIVIDHMAEVVPINNIYDLYIWIAVHKPTQLNDSSILEALGKWGTVKDYMCKDDELIIHLEDFNQECGALCTYALFLKQVYPEYSKMVGLTGTNSGRLCIHLCKA
jgi:hypothetical protein